MKPTSKNGMRGVLWGVLAFALAGAGCELIAAPDRTLIPGEGGGGTGGAGECAVAADCPDPGECLERACVDSVCSPSPVAAGTSVGDQKAGDCQVVVCDGQGSTASQADDADLPVDGKECTDDVCTGGVASNPPVSEGTACGDGSMLCDDMGACVGCIVDEDCGDPTECAAPKCNAGTCETDFVPPGTPALTQTDGDCLVVQCDGIGGTKVENDDADITDDGSDCTLDVCQDGAATHPNAPSGTACADGGFVCNGAGACVECINGGDCDSGVCISQVCAAPECMDDVANGDETDVDCGGSCPPCGTAFMCLVAADCLSGVCTGNKCAAPSCSDTVENGNESDVDCGGNACPKCSTGKACNGNSDCVGGLCTGNTCVPTCTDTLKNGTESDVDCGGSCAAKCQNGQVCNGDNDCGSGHCSGNVCVQCVGAGDCPATGNECVVATCTGNACGTMNLDQTHTLSTGQTAGDCQKIVCDGAGGTTSIGDATDLPVSNTACLVSPACTGNPLAPSFTPATQGADCTADGAPPNDVCGGGANAGVCVECNSGAECDPASCNGAMFTEAATCSAAGSCVAGATTDCSASGQLCDETLGCVECLSPADCPDPGNECVVATCSANVCGTMNLDQTHTLSTGQTSGDCQKIVCDGAGGTTSADDATDLPVSSSVCLINPACTGAPLTPSFDPAPTGTDCTADGTPGGFVCGDATAEGMCVECNVDGDCAAGTCDASHTCVP
ncbi:MAG: hypothetical protein R3B70_08425 [Polyangiaceae bacterium]